MPIKAEISELLVADFPPSKCIVEAVGASSVAIRHPVGFAEWRPDGTVSGPVMIGK